MWNENESRKSSTSIQVRAHEKDTSHSVQSVQTEYVPRLVRGHRNARVRTPSARPAHRLRSTQCEFVDCVRKLRTGQTNRSACERTTLKERPDLRCQLPT